ncbi:MAG TPA: hypothetical protein DDW21_05895 [Verrucomicrobiales bacterium]|nr:MAG: hypothetical protein CAK88_07305 [Verrucomicrobiae bacterium AMD-G2]HBE22965.1 hypothetical protein [Verrucomicrobiales bacterium]
MKFMKQFTALVLILSLCSCSLFAPSKQPVTVNSNVSSVNIMANGESKGQTPVTFEAQRNQSLHIVATKSGYKPSTYTVDRQLSGTAMADIVGGLFFGVPFIGLFGPGAWKLEQDNVMVPMSR